MSTLRIVTHQLFPILFASILLSSSLLISTLNTDRGKQFKSITVPLKENTMSMLRSQKTRKMTSPESVTTLSNFTVYHTWDSNIVYMRKFIILSPWLVWKTERENVLFAKCPCYAHFMWVFCGDTVLSNHCLAASRIMFIMWTIHSTRNIPRAVH